MTINDIETAVLPNGARLIVHPRPGFRGAAVGIWLGNGVRHQRADRNGFAHLLEHLLLSDKGARNDETFSESCERLGGRVNAETGRELTALYGIVPGERAAELLGLLRSRLTNIEFDAETLARERAVVMHEMEGLAAAPEQAIEEAAMELAWPDDALGWPILGRAEVVETATSGQLQEYLETCLNASRLWVVATGAVDHAAIMQACAPLSALPNRPSATVKRPVFRKGRYRDRRHTANSHLLWMLSVAPSSHPDYAALLMGRYILGGGMASRLFRELRASSGLVYGIHTRLEFLSDTGLFFMQTSCDASNSAHCQRAVESVITRFLRDGPEPRELDRARSHLLAGLVLEEDDLELGMQRLAREAVYLGRHPAAEEYADMLASVAAKGVRVAFWDAWESRLVLVWDPA